MRSLRALFVSVVVFLHPATVSAAHAAPPLEEGNSVLLTLLHTNDLHGQIYLPGKPQGLSKVATVVRRIRTESPHVLLLDAGDIIHGTPVEKASEGRAIISAMNAIGYDAAAAGNHEFDRGQAVARRAFALAKFPFLSASVLDSKTGEPWVNPQPFILREIEGVRVAVFGLTTPGTVDIEWPRTLEGLTFADDIPVAREWVERLRTRERADVVIAVTHLGLAADKKLATAVPGIDVILGGHSHTRLDKQVWEGPTLITQTGSLAVTLGRVDLLIQKPTDGGPPTITINGKDGHWWGHEGIPVPPAGAGQEFPAGPLIPMTESIADDPAVVEAYRPFADAVLPGLEEVLTEATEPLPAIDARHHEVAVGQIVADAIRAHARTDLALASSSQINVRGLVKGPVRVADLYEMLPAYTRQHIVVMRIPGALLREMVGQVFSPGKLPVHISGFRVAGEDIFVADEPLDDARTYSIAAAAHVLQGYFLGKAGAEVVIDDVETPHVRDALIEFLRSHPPLSGAVEKRVSR